MARRLLKYTGTIPALLDIPKSLRSNDLRRDASRCKPLIINRLQLILKHINRFMSSFFLALFFLTFYFTLFIICVIFGYSYLTFDC